MLLLYEKGDQLSETYKMCKVHLQRMQFAHSKIEYRFPLTGKEYDSIGDDELSRFDQFIYRFTKLQDCMGSKLFKSLLDNLGEETRAVPFVDIFARLETLEIIDKANDWLLLREIRNLLTHEYPSNKQDIIDGLNLLNENYQLLISIWNQIETYILKKFSYLITAENK